MPVVGTFDGADGPPDDRRRNALDRKELDLGCWGTYGSKLSAGSPPPSLTAEEHLLKSVDFAGGVGGSDFEPFDVVSDLCGGLV